MSLILKSIFGYYEASGSLKGHSEVKINMLTRLTLAVQNLSIIFNNDFLFPINHSFKNIFFV
ncbi:hypothetical protein Hanom_Chr13g01192801 [Helianthus anomalus]